MPTLDELIVQFRIEYAKAYQSILPDGVLSQGNTWFEDFLRRSVSQIVREVVPKKLFSSDGDVNIFVDMKSWNAARQQMLDKAKALGIEL